MRGHIFLAATAALLAAPAMAQTTGPADGGGAAQPGMGASDQTQPGTAQPDASMPDATQQAQPSQQQPAGADVASVVESEFPTYDTDKNGALSKSEFTAWMATLKKAEAQSTGKAMTEKEIAAWSKSAFATADADKSGSVSKAELTKFLGG